MKESELDQFLRIANARLRRVYRFKPQRQAVIARMYREWIERKDWEAAWKSKDDV